MPRGRPRKRKRSSSAPPSLQSPKKRLKWSDESMVNAINAVKSGRCSVKRAAEDYKVPRTTLQDRIAGRVIHGTKPGPSPYLNKEEESELAQFVVEVSEIGYGKTRKQIKGMVEKVANEKGILKNKAISDGWFRRFLERQPQLRLRKGDRTAQVRLDAMNNREALENYFSLLKSTLEENDLTNKPSQIYNVDESGVPLDHRSPYVLTKKGQKKVRYISSGNKAQITVVGCINASGQAIPPFIVFDAKNFNLQWTEHEVPGTTYGLSDSGWMDMELFKAWFYKHFLTHVCSNRPILLLLDGHSSHYNLEAINLAKENGVIMFTLVPHTTHAMQPLDTAVYGPLKTHWQDACHDYLQKNPGRVINKYVFNEVFSKAWLKSISPETIINGFRVCGVSPFNPCVIMDKSPDNSGKKDTSSSVQESHDCEQAGSQSTEAAITFTAAEEQLFLKRYAEGYNIPDSKYISWLKVNHPETDFTIFSTEPSLLDFFPDTSPLDAVAMFDDPPNSETEAEECASNVTSPDDAVTPRLLNVTSPDDAVTPRLSNVTSPDDAVTPRRSNVTSPDDAVTPRLSNVTSPDDAVTPRRENEIGSLTPNSLSSENASSVSSKARVTPPNVLSKYLVQYVPASQEKKKASETRVTGLRVLTSAEGIAILKEKEEKKQKEKEEKEKRKQDRLEKRKQKEELAKRKADERKKKSNSTAKKTVRPKKRPAVAVSNADAAETSTEKTSGRRKRSATVSVATRAKTSEIVDEGTVSDDCSELDAAETSTEKTSGWKKRPATVSAATRCETVDEGTVSDDDFEGDCDYECSECLGSYQQDVDANNGAEWVRCGCGQWIHEDCIDQVLTGTDGKDRLCSNCVL